MIVCDKLTYIITEKKYSLGSFWVPASWGSTKRMWSFEREPPNHPFLFGISHELNIYKPSIWKFGVPLFMEPPSGYLT